MTGFSLFDNQARVVQELLTHFHFLLKFRHNPNSCQEWPRQTLRKRNVMTELITGRDSLAMPSESIQ